MVGKYSPIQRFREPSEAVADGEQERQVLVVIPGKALANHVGEAILSRQVDKIRVRQLQSYAVLQS